MNLFLISSPLQALNVSLLASAEIGGPSKFLLEEPYHFPITADHSDVVAIRYTRGRKLDAIRENLEIIDRVAVQPVHLWVSDLFWPMNSAAYSLLRNSGRLASINFFDEGMVLYWKYKLGWLQRIRELARSLSFRARLGAYAFLPSKPFLEYDSFGRLYCIHPELLPSDSGIFPITVNEEVLNKYLQDQEWSFDDDLRKMHSSPLPVLFLSQPYFRVSSGSNYRQLIEDLRKYLIERGYRNFFLKMHPSETRDDYGKYYSEAGFEQVLSKCNMPIEALSARLDPIAVVSFNSSSLFNMGKFGLKAPRIAFGLDYIQRIYPLQRSLLREQTDIMRRTGVEVVNSRA